MHGSGEIPAERIADPTLVPHERLFGDIELIQLPLDSLIDLSQIRGTANPRYDEIKESIDTGDLGYPVNVTRLTTQELSDYIDFTNATWGGEVTLENFARQQQPDGRYNLVVAGHTRTQTMRDIAATFTAETGRPTNYSVTCIPLQDSSVEAIVSKQADENLHGAVTQERSAMAIVELYNYGLGNKWETPEEFRTSQKGKVNKRMMTEAITFAELAPNIRTLVFSGHISYKAGIVLGKAAPTVRDWFASEVGMGADESMDEDLEAAAQERLLADAAYVWNHRLNSTAAARYVQSFTQKMQKDIAERRGEADPEAIASFTDEPMFTMVSASSQARTIRRREEARKATILREVSQQPFVTSTELILILAGVERSAAVEQVLQDASLAHEMLDRQLAKVVDLHLVPPQDELEFELTEAVG